MLTTSSGIMDHEEARRKHTGGKILGFFYWFLLMYLICHVALLILNRIYTQCLPWAPYLFELPFPPLSHSELVRWWNQGKIKMRSMCQGISGSLTKKVMCDYFTKKCQHVWISSAGPFFVASSPKDILCNVLSCTTHISYSHSLQSYHVPFLFLRQLHTFQ